LEIYSLGTPFANIVTPASQGNGIEVIPGEAQQKLVQLYEENKADLDIVKFIPASGAATRMFKFLYLFLEQFDPEKHKLGKHFKDQPNEELKTFFENLKYFAFINELRRTIRGLYPDYKTSTRGQRFYWLIEAMLSAQGMNFGNLPKGLIPFHKYTKYYTTAFEEQLYESAFYAAARDDVYLHFTFSEEHVEAFKMEFQAIQSRVEKKTRVNYHISYSFQKKETDVMAVNSENRPSRNEKGELLLRPAGHGALLENLNDVDADVVFIKNIDNVAAEEYAGQIAFYKKVLAGKLVWLQRKIFNYLELIDSDQVDDEKVKEIRSFLWNELSIKDIPFDPPRLHAILNRPLRVCGVVPNTGATGGGPFWVKDENEQISLQIVEMAQIDLTDQRNKTLIEDASHFNPVDLVCGLRNYKGEKFDLMKYRDERAHFITQKFEEGVLVKALELPGLWNGGMAHWNTAFVEVPGITFNPVKTVNDLLKKEHQPNA
jgi:hypothetical protein